MQYASWFTHLRDSTGILHERARSLDHLLETYQVLVSPRAFALTGMAAGLFVLGVAISEREALLRERAEIASNLFLVRDLAGVVRPGDRSVYLCRVVARNCLGVGGQLATPQRPGCPSPAWGESSSRWPGGDRCVWADFSPLCE